MTFLIDDVIFYVYNPAVKDASTWPFFEDQFILLNVAMGGIAGAVDPSLIQTTMSIDYVRVYQSSGLSNKDFEIADVKVYPNPATEKVNLILPSNIQKFQLRILSNDGKCVRQMTTDSRSISVNDLATGYYIVEVISESGIARTKICVE